MPEPLINSDETLDAFTRTLRIIQKKRGHRAASDDVFLAWAAVRAHPEAKRVLDLGSGKGTVAILMLHSLPQCRVVGVEALAVSHELAVRNAFLNGLENRYEPKFGDLRDPQVLSGELPFDLISGAPPFKQIGTGTLPKCAQRAASRFEFRGGVEEYAKTASMHLAPDGKVVILMDGLASSRVRAERSLLSVGLFPHLALSVRPRPGSAPVYWIIEAGRKPSDIMERTVSMRPAVGTSWSQEYTTIRREMDLP